MTSEGSGEMFEGDSADMCAGKFPLVSMGGQAEGLACADPGARTPIFFLSRPLSLNFSFLYLSKGNLDIILFMSQILGKLCSICSTI